MGQQTAIEREDIWDRLEQGGPVAHNLIGLTLAQIDRAYGRAEANRAIRECGLDSLGWSERP